MQKNISRRAVLLRGLQIPVGGAILALGGCGKASDPGSAAASRTCANPDTMTNAELGTRGSLNYTDASTNPQQVCADCAFFHAAAGGCGTCDMFSGGPVDPAGRCDSWSAKG